MRSMRRWHYPGPGPLGEPEAPDAGTARNETTIGGTFAQLVDPALVETLVLGGALVAVHERLQGDLDRLVEGDDDLYAAAADGAMTAIKLLSGELGRRGVEAHSCRTVRG